MGARPYSQFWWRSLARDHCKDNRIIDSVLPDLIPLVIPSRHVLDLLSLFSDTSQMSLLAFKASFIRKWLTTRCSSQENPQVEER
jgi:hypothetical protein